MSCRFQGDLPRQYRQQNRELASPQAQPGVGYERSLLARPQMWLSVSLEMMHLARWSRSNVGYDVGPLRGRGIRISVRVVSRSRKESSSAICPSARSRRPVMRAPASRTAATEPGCSFSAPRDSSRLPQPGRFAQVPIRRHGEIVPNWITRAQVHRASQREAGTKRPLGLRWATRGRGRHQSWHLVLAMARGLPRGSLASARRFPDVPRHVACPAQPIGRSLRRRPYEGTREVSHTVRGDQQLGNDRSSVSASFC